MAYNLQTLITILEQILEPQQKCRIHDDDKHQLKSLLEKAIFLQQILEKYSLPNIDNLEREIRDVVHKAEDIIESCMVDRMRSASLTEELLISFSSADLQQVTQQLDSATEQVGKLVEMEAGKTIISSTSGGPSSSSGGAAAAASFNPKSAKASTVVGFDEDLMELKDRLTGMQRKLEIIPIVGMGGIGKTTLARNLYEDPLIVSRFQYARAWATVSQDYNMKTILLSLLFCITGKEVVGGDVSVLKDRLYQSLYGRRYLIVLDDIWSTQVWDEMRMFFPDNNNGSRVVITTRESNVATYANSKSRQHAVQLLSQSASWNLLRQIVFGEDNDDCPCELEWIGRKIARDCGGLPLAITVIGGLLSKVERSKDVWRDIGENVSGAIAKSDDGGQYSSILSLSYNHLPSYLKPCFLYMGAFPEDYEIKGSALVCYWIAEGFIKPNRDDDKSLEEVAEEYLMGLVERNLLIARQNKSICKPMSYAIHDVLRDLCIAKANEDNFLHVVTNDHGTGRESMTLRRVSSEQGYSYEMKDTEAEVMSLTRSFRFTGRRWWQPSPVVSYISSVSNLLRVLDIMYLNELREFPKQILQLVNLRYLGLSCTRLSVGISRLVNLQILINRCSYIGSVPSEIWKMSGLRYLKFSRLHFTSEDDNNEMLVEMHKLHTLSCVKLKESLLERGFLQAIPNIKTLGILWASEQLLDLSHLHKLETLTCKGVYREDCRFPPTLRKLTLNGGLVYPCTVTTLCGLPNLEVLHLKGCSFYTSRGATEEWKSRQGDEFRSLQFLQLEDLELMRWIADETNFPKLRHLLVNDCRQLKEISSGIGEIPTLELIEMKACSASSVESAKEIVEVQHSEYAN